MDTLALVQLLIPVLAPLLIAGGKLLIPRIPRWLLPILAPLLGGALDALAAYATGGTANPVLALALGSAGVGLREIVDQLKRTAAGA